MLLKTNVHHNLVNGFRKSAQSTLIELTANKILEKRHYVLKMQNSQLLTK